MIRSRLWMLCAVCWMILCGIVRGDEDAVREAMRTTYVDAFNTNDAAAVAALWSENAVYVDRETEERLEGREALQEILTRSSRRGRESASRAM